MVGSTDALTLDVGEQGQHASCGKTWISVHIADSAEHCGESLLSANQFLLHTVVIACYTAKVAHVLTLTTHPAQRPLYRPVYRGSTCMSR